MSALATAVQASSKRGPGAQFLTDVENAISDAFEPVATAVGNVIFYSPEIGGRPIPLIVFWLVIAAAVFTVYFRGVQFTSLGTAMDLVRGKYSRMSDPGEVTHFQALSSAVSGTVGLGNIAGVGVAMTIGGPGAMFWMVVAGLLGMCTKFVECTLGVRYREVHEDGTVTGGPFRYMPAAFDRFSVPVSKILVALFAIALICFGALGGNAFQANQTYAQAVEITGGVEDSPIATPPAALIFGIVLASLVGLVIIGGVKSIGRVTGKLVPFMAVAYVLACLLVIIGNIDHVPEAVVSIITGAFSPDAGFGGLIGVLIVGFQRAAFSNEAGVGSAPIVHSAVKTKHPVSEGYVALFEPLIDTIVVCSMTALTIIIADTQFYNDAQADYVNEGVTADGVVVTSRAFDTFLPGFSNVLAVGVALFAFSTLITWSYYTMKAWTTLVGRSKAKENAFKLIFCIFTVIGAVVNLGSVLNFADAMLFVCAIFNLLACYILLPKVKEEVKKFRDGVASGEIQQVPVAERANT